MRLRLLPLFTGLALGAGAGWGLRQAIKPAPPLPGPRASGPGAASSAGSAPAGPRSPGLVLPPRLAPEEAGAALAAWLALGVPAGTGAKPADFATQATALRALLTVLPDDRLPALLAALVSREGGDARRLRQAAFDIWVERSAPDAARWAAAAPTGKAFDAKARLRFVQQAAKAWAQLDFDASYAWAGTLADPELAGSLAGALINQLAATDPVRALALAQARGPDFLKAGQRDLFAAWAESDPAAAIRAMGPGLLENDSNVWYVQKALGTWLGRDAPAAVTWILAQPSSDANDPASLLRQTFWNMSENTASLRPMAEALATQADAGRRFSFLSALLETWNQKDPAAALAWLDTLPDAAQRTDLLERAIPSFDPDIKDPARYLPLALHLPPGAARDAKIADFLGGWAGADPDAALAWLREHDDPALAPAAARVQGTLIGALASSDPAAAVARWQALPAGDIRDAAVPALAAAWAKTDPAAATRWTFDQVPDQPAMPDNPAAYAALTPEAQIALMKAYENHRRQAGPFANALNTWFEKDPVAAMDWAGTLPNPAQRQIVLNALGSVTFYSDAEVPDPVERAALLVRVKDPDLRLQVLSTHLGRWSRSDLPSARAWIESNEALSPEQAAELLSRAGIATR